VQGAHRPGVRGGSHQDPQPASGASEKICAVLEALESRPAFLESIAESSLAITVGSWRFRYEFEPLRNRVTVVQAIPA